MNKHDATEQAYKNGYKAGYEAAYFEMSIDTENRKMTNFEKIKNMSVEEMTEFMVLVNTCGCDCCKGICAVMNCNDGFKNWLESEAK